MQLDLAPYRKPEPTAREIVERMKRTATIRYAPADYARLKRVAHTNGVSMNNFVIAATIAALDEVEGRSAR